MRGRVFLWVSVSLNALLAVAVWRSIWTPTDPSAAPLPTPTNTTVGVIRTNVVVRRLNFVWNQIESDDYPTFIANLRNIGCPESTIRDIILADINQLFAKRRATEISTPSQQWWLSDPDEAVASLAATQIRALESERRALLARLLGPDWESSAYPYPEPSDVIPLDGALLGTLSPSARAAVQRVERLALDRRRSYLEEAAAAGHDADPAELIRLRQETRQELARLLTPEQLEEYLLRYSQSAADLREQLRGVTVTSDEFRGLFRALDQRANPAGGATPSPSTAGPTREELLRQTLGAERYEALQLRNDPLYQQARGVVDQAGVPENQLVPLAAILRLTQEEESRISADRTLSASERLEALNSARQDEMDALRKLIGPEAFERYLENHPDLGEKKAP